MDRPRGELRICGPSGTGKSHLAEALGRRAIDEGKTVAWHTLESLATLLRRHRADDSVSKAIGRLIRADLIVSDDIGMLPVAPDAAEALRVFCCCDRQAKLPRRLLNRDRLPLRTETRPSTLSGHYPAFQSYAILRLLPGIDVVLSFFGLLANGPEPGGSPRVRR